MENINEKSHFTTVIKSLNNNYKYAKINGKINNKELYYLNLIYNILFVYNLDLNIKEKNKFKNIYTKLINSSKNICKANYNLIFKNTIKNFTQSETDDCDSVPEINNNKIYYWQENSFVTNDQDIVDLLSFDFLETKSSTSYNSFINGFRINYTNIGKICFVDNNSESTNYEILDELGNNITFSFTIINVPELKYTLIISKNIYSFGEIFIKIKKIT